MCVEQRQQRQGIEEWNNKTHPYCYVCVSSIAASPESFLMCVRVCGLRLFTTK